uniref:Uncharacterized protein n=1 Tax=Arundo donax TaxID=35708 RepID=A0A0A9AHP3_ARUDO
MAPIELKLTVAALVLAVASMVEASPMAGGIDYSHGGRDRFHPWRA